jgi:hypothetical protein
MTERDFGMIAAAIGIGSMYAWQGIWAAIVGIAALLLIAVCCCGLHPASKGPRATPSNSSLIVYHLQPV